MYNKPITQVVTVTANPAIDLMVVADDWERGRVNRGTKSYTRLGGKGIQVATGLSDLLVDSNTCVIATGWLGSDNDSGFIDHFKQFNIEDMCIRVAGETRTNVKITDSHDNDTTDINFVGLTIPTPAQEQLSQLIQDKVCGQTAVVLAGSLPHGVSDDFYLNHIKNLQTTDSLIVLDASGTALDIVVKNKAFPHVMKPNIHELRSVTKQDIHSPQEIVTATKDWFDNGLELLVVSLGEEGALFITASDIVKSIPPHVEIFSTVGAGDAMVAGITYGYIQNWSLVELARFATACSVARIAVHEAGTSLLDRAKQLSNDISIDIVNTTSAS